MTTFLYYTLRCSVVIVFMCALLCSQLSIAAENNIKNTNPTQPPRMLGEIWTGSIYTSTFEAGACFAEDGRVRGVLLVKLSNGQVDTYHFQGTMDSNGVIYTTHKSGHSFVGKFQDEHNISGEVTLSNGFSTTLDGRRLQNVQLNERCGPITE